MVLSIIKQAVRAKMTCKSPSPIISEPEFCYASAYALKQMKMEQLLREAYSKQTIGELRKLILPALEQEKEAFADQPEMKRLIQLLAASRIEGEITEEIRELLI